MRTVIVSLSMLSLFSLGTLAQTPATGANLLLGTWTLETQDTRRADTGEPIAAETSDEFAGVLTYDASGRMAVQIDRSAWNPDRPYTAYFGTYTVDAAEGVVLHHVQAGTVASYTGTDQRREFELRDSGNTLVLRNRRLAYGSDSVRVVTNLVWRRAN